MQNLSLQIAKIDIVEIDQAKFANAGSRKIKRRRRTESARADAQNARSIQAPLPFRADFRHDHVPRIPKLFVLRHLILTSSQLIPTIRLFSNRFNDFGKMR